jgi:hypothetical protein
MIFDAKDLINWKLIYAISAFIFICGISIGFCIFTLIGDLLK